MQQTSIPFRQEWQEALRDCTKSVRLKFYEAIIAYALTGKVPPLQPTMRLAFNLVRSTIDQSREGGQANPAEGNIPSRADKKIDTTCSPQFSTLERGSLENNKSDKDSEEKTLLESEKSHKRNKNSDKDSEEQPLRESENTDKESEEQSPLESGRNFREREETESKQEKEKCPPHPLTKEKEIKKEKEAKENLLLLGEKKEKSTEREVSLTETKGQKVAERGEQPLVGRDQSLAEKEEKPLVGRDQSLTKKDEQSQSESEQLQSESEQFSSENGKPQSESEQLQSESEQPQRKQKERQKERRESLEERRERFREEVFSHAGDYPSEVLNRFCNYWSEENHTGRKMRYEMEKTWNTHLRLRNWASRDKAYQASRSLQGHPFGTSLIPNSQAYESLLPQPNPNLNTNHIHTNPINTPYYVTNAPSGTPSTREQRDREAAAIILRFQAENAAGTAYPNAPF